MTSQTDPLLVKIQTQLLRATFIKNMAVLKEHMPAIYHYYQNYTPSKVQLSLDSNGHVNLIANGEFVYQNDPKLSSQAQVDKFLKKPPHFNFDIPIHENDQLTMSMKKLSTTFLIKEELI